MGDGDIVYRGAVVDGMGAGCGIFSFGNDAQAGGVAGCFIHPAGFSGYFFEDLFGEGDGGATGGVFLLGVVHFYHAHLVFLLRGHQFGQPAIQLKKDVHADAEIAGIQEGLVFF